MMKNKNLRSFLALALGLLLALQCALPIVAVAAEALDGGEYGEAIYIENADDLLELAKSCSIDAWSVGKTIVLNNDITLDGVEFSPIPTFGGTFDGNGHTISGLNITDGFSPSGLFANIQSTGILKNLNVIGSVTPNGKNVLVGGIAGKNYGSIMNCTFTGTVIGEKQIGGIAALNGFSGIITDCTVSGEIIGENITGGIVGENEGLISSCKNQALVNTISVDPHISLDELNASLTVDITKFPSFGTVTTTSDTGGIAGHSSGVILGCENQNTVGYKHIGYNVGGIVGRNCGHIANCENSAKILGRKDVGGIVGQAEPDVELELSEDLIAKLEGELNELRDMINDASYSADDSNAAIEARIDTILTLLESATEKTHKLTGQIGDYGDGVITEINRGSEIVSNVISRLYGISEEFPEISEQITSSLDDLELGLEYLKEASKLGEAALDDLKLAGDNIALSIKTMRSGADKINEGIDLIESALEVGDKNAVENGLADISAGISELTASVSEMSAALDGVITVFENAGWTKDALSQIKSVITELDNITSVLNLIYDEVTVVKENIDVNWSKIEEGTDEIIASLGHLREACSKMDAALAYAESGIGKINDGIALIQQSVEIKDAEAVSAAIGEIGEGFSELAEATEKASEALNSISENAGNINGLTDLFENTDELAADFGKLASSLSEASTALGKISSGVRDLSENVELHPENAEEGALLIIGGFEDLELCISKLREANASMEICVEGLQSALTDLKSGIDVKDEAAIRSALDKIHELLGDMLNYFEGISEVTKQMADTMDEAYQWGESTVAAMREMSDAFASFSNAITKVQGGVDAIQNNIAFDFDSAKKGGALIREGLNTFVSASTEFEAAIENGQNAIDDIKGASQEITNATTCFESALSDLELAAEAITDVFIDIEDLFEYLENVEPLQIQKPSEEISATANELYADICAIETELKALSTEISSAGTSLTAYIRSINDKFSGIMNTVVDMIYHVESENEIFNDASDEDIASVKEGKIFCCINSGRVSGDINVGGIVGIIGIEYEADPEDDISSGISLTRKKSYELKAIIQNCVSTGSIVAKKDCVGAICGKMDFGLIVHSEAYGSVESESGDYVGGLVGLCAGSVKDSFAKCTLSGNYYVGGIIGCGVTEAVVSASSKVKDCYSLVNIKGGKQYLGAIAGDDAGVFENNYFVSDTLAGINRISYVGKAEPIAYNELLDVNNLPSELKSFKLSFVADGNIICETIFNYGDSFEESVIPSAPAKEGYYYEWDSADLSSLKFDKTVNAIYIPYLTSVESEQTRGEKSPIFFVEGSFIEEDKLICEMQALNSSDFVEKFGENVLEQWKLIIPNDGKNVHTVRLLTPNRSFLSLGYRIYILENGTWIQAECKEIGSYLAFRAEGNELEIAIVELEIPRTVILTSIGAIILLLLGLIAISIVNRKRKTIKRIDCIENDDDTSLQNEAPDFEKMKRYPRRSFEEKYKALSEEMQSRYREVANHILSIDGVKEIKSKFCVSYRHKKKTIAKVYIKGKTINAYLALEPDKYEKTKYVFIDASDSKAHVKQGMRIKLTSRRQVKHTKELLDVIAEEIKG